MAKNSKKQLKLVVITGTPGTGKTTIAKKLSLLLDYAYLNGSELVKTAHLAEEYDKTRHTDVVDPSKFAFAVLRVRDLLAEKGKKGLIVDSHLAHFLPVKVVDTCVVLTCSLPMLESRLKKKGWDAAKIRENLDAEIFDTILIEATEKKHNVIKLDTTKIFEKDIKKLAKFLEKI